MKKAFLTVAALLAFGIASAQTDSTSTKKSSSKVKSEKASKKTDAASQDKTADRKRKKNTQTSSSSGSSVKQPVMGTNVDSQDTNSGTSGSTTTKKP